jgi:hypothetical protein
MVDAKRVPSPALTLLLLLALLATACRAPAYDLALRVTDQSGNPLPGAMVGLNENGQTLLADQEGRVAWTELEEDQASLVIVVPGYVLHTAVLALEPGANEATIALEPKESDVPLQVPDDSA